MVDRVSDQQQSVRSATESGCRRSDKDSRSNRDAVVPLENTIQTQRGKITSIKDGGSGNPSRDRLVYITTCLIGHDVEVHVKDGSVYSGIFHATNAENDFGVILKIARQKNSSKPPSKVLIIPAKELVQLRAKDVPITMDGLKRDHTLDRSNEIAIDSSLSNSRQVEVERELEPWVPDDGVTECEELETMFDGPWNRKWDQFETNEALFGVKSTFDEEIYTTKLERGPHMRQLEKEAIRIAREMESEETRDSHLAEERGNAAANALEDVDEETKYSSVSRRVDDDGSVDSSCNAASSSCSSNNGSSSPATAAAPPTTAASGLPSAADDGILIITPQEEPPTIVPDKSNSTTSPSSLQIHLTSVGAAPPAAEKGRLSPNAAEFSPQQRVTTTQPRTGVALSPSSSVSSLSSERSMLNPYAKEFKLNPNARSFVPAPLRSASPVLGLGVSYYMPANPPPPTVPLHPLPVSFAVGLGPPFPGHHHSMIPPAPNLQPYFPSTVPQYGQQLVAAHPRPVVYVPSYPVIMD